MPSLLLVEDELSLQALLEKYLTRSGFQVSCSSNGPDALAMLTSPFDFAVIDLTLPGMDGWTVMEGVRKALPDIFIVIISGYPLGDRERLGQAVYLQKPFLPSRLAELLRPAQSGKGEEVLK